MLDSRTEEPGRRFIIFRIRTSNANSRTAPHAAIVALRFTIALVASYTIECSNKNESHVRKGQGDLTIAFEIDKDAVFIGTELKVVVLIAALQIPLTGAEIIIRYEAIHTPKGLVLKEGDELDGIVLDKLEVGQIKQGIKLKVSRGAADGRPRPREQEEHY